MTHRIIWLCLQSRLFISGLAIGSDLLLPDHNADAYRNNLLSKYPSGSLSNLDRTILSLSNAFTRWDAQYFLAIAHENRYLEEQMLAFFPLFPLVIRYLSIAFQQLMANLFALQLSFLSCLAITAYLLNLLAFILAGIFLYKLTNLMFHSESVSHRVVQLFAFNPASIFFTAFYTESLFCCLTFGALYCLYRFNSPFMATILFALSAYTRSNGIVAAIGYIAFYQLIDLFSKLRSNQSTLSILVRFIVYTLFYVFVCLLPFLFYQQMAWEEFCQFVTKSTPDWCNSQMPFPYNSVQSKYWEVGFLRYYQLKKIPNFIMAAPTLILVIWTCTLYLNQNYSYLTGANWSIFGTSSRVRSLIEPNQPEKGHKKIVMFKQTCLLPFVIHSLFLAVFCLLFMHVEVATRFLHSSSPWPYWALFHFTNRNLLGVQTKSLVFYWQLVYCLIGTIMFANYLPFT